MITFLVYAKCAPRTRGCKHMGCRKASKQLSTWPRPSSYLFSRQGSHHSRTNRDRIIGLKIDGFRVHTLHVLPLAN